MGNKLVLRAMTLRGIGSYLHGARLEVRPLTILCGENGSGKSTWFKVLNMLLRTQKIGQLPSSFDLEPGDIDDSLRLQYTNALVYFEYADSRHAALNTASEKEFGLLGTVGLELEATESLALDDSSGEPVDANTVAQRFLWRGECDARTCFRIRLTRPKHTWGDDESTRTLKWMTELQLNDKLTIALTDHRHGEPYWQAGDDPVRCSKAFLSGHKDEDPEIVELADKDLSPRIATRMMARIHQLLGGLLDGYFYIGAVRLPYLDPLLDKLLQDEDVDLKDLRNRRYVGPAGKATWFLEREFAYNRMHQPEPPYSGCFDQSFTAKQSIERHLPGEIVRHTRQPKMQRVWDVAAPELKEEAERLDETPRRFDADPSSDEGFLRYRHEHALRLLNDVLHRRELYDPAVWPYLDPDGEAKYLVDCGVENLHPSDLERLNRLLIESAVVSPEWTWTNEVPYGYLLEGYVSYWLRQLVQTRIILRSRSRYESFSLGDGWTSTVTLPNGVLVNTYPAAVSAFSQADGGNSMPLDEDSKDLTRLKHVCFDTNECLAQPPKQMSAGFHQLAPIIVQTGLMQRGELLAIENPEVHLHPSLQLKVTEFLLHQARAGKMMFIETHSDLVVRRAIRAILQEEISQEEVRIYFCDIDESHEGYRYSRLRPMQVSELGRIDNWPKGFMASDISESRRLFEVMYGALPEDGEDATG